MHWSELEVWKKSHNLVKEMYSITSTFPKDELYALTSQIRRSSVSIPANIVEGCSRNTTKEYMQFLFNARGSLEELRYLMFLSGDLNYIPKQKLTNLESMLEEISKMLNALINSLKNKAKIKGRA